MRSSHFYGIICLDAVAGAVGAYPLFPEIAVAISTAGVAVPVPGGQMRYSLTADSMEPAPIARRPSLVNFLFEFRFPIEAALLFWSYAIHLPRP
jgi:hypothetical protein